MPGRSRREWLPVEQIDEGVRFRKEYGDLDILGESITEFGEPIQAVVVMETGEPKKYLLLAGGRRFAYHKKAGEKLVKADIWPADLTELERRKIEYAENYHRKGLTWQEEIDLTAEIDRLIKEEKGEASATQAEVAEFIGKDRSAISRDLQLHQDILHVPELRDAKSKKDALTKATALRERMVKEEIARRTEKKLESDGGWSGKKKELVESYILADCTEYMPTIADSTYDLVEFDPPYGIAFEETHKGNTWLSDQGDGYVDFSGLDEYTKFLRTVYAQAFRILRETGWILTWCSTEYLTQTCELLEEAGFLPSRIPIIWAKPPGTVAHNHHPDFKFTVDYETAVYARRSKKSLLNLRGPNSVRNWPGVSPDVKIHPNEKPSGLIGNLITTFVPSGSSIFVPCAGSGNTIFVGNTRGGSKVVGTDVSEHSRNSYIARVDAWDMGVYLPDEKQKEEAVL